MNQTPLHTVPGTDSEGNQVFREVVAVTNLDGSPISITGSGDASTATMQQKILAAQLALNSILGETLPAMFDTSYATTVVSFTYANLYYHINPDGSIDKDLMYSQRFDLTGLETWFLEYKDGSSSVLSANKSESDADIAVLSEFLIQSITESRTLIGSTPPVTSTRTRTHAMWPPHWMTSDSGWQ